ncbi:MAG: undecaprenyldiphospho-muramoylpentapeptide beta-N-acetylglucosaminyltransferase [Bacilli bacterium]|nr:undecaprenyldiphospho-muramoylpentapeptide beta-N-acetylglucosaminyltransferase [Bacilli bacterium]
MRVIVAAGGTGGHIYPALAIVNKIKEKEPNSEFLYIGTHNRMEKDIVPKAGIPFKGIEMYGFNKRKLLSNFKTMKCVVKGYQECKKAIKDFKPDIVIGVGGYITVPVILAAHKLGIKTFIHEQNSIPGKSNLFLSKYVSKIGVSFKSSLHKFPSYKTVFTGNPCSEEASTIKPADKAFYGLDPHKKCVLIVMGSLGSSTFNTYLLKHIQSFKEKNYEVVFVTGKNDYEKIKQTKMPKNVFLFPFVDHLPSLMKKVDVMVSRAGASTMSELIALEIPTILIPSPFVANNHQYKNAKDLTDEKAAILLEEKDLEGNILFTRIEEAMDPIMQTEIKHNLRKLQVPKSATKIYNELQEIIDRK